MNEPSIVTLCQRYDSFTKAVKHLLIFYTWCPLDIWGTGSWRVQEHSLEITGVTLFSFYVMWARRGLRWRGLVLGLVTLLSVSVNVSVVGVSRARVLRACAGGGGQLLPPPASSGSQQVPPATGWRAKKIRGKGSFTIHYIFLFDCIGCIILQEWISRAVIQKIIAWTLFQRTVLVWSKYIRHLHVEIVTGLFCSVMNRIKNVFSLAGPVSRIAGHCGVHGSGAHRGHFMSIHRSFALEQIFWFGSITAGVRMMEYRICGSTDIVYGTL